MTEMDSEQINWDDRNSKILSDFVAFCHQNPGLRFWQALAIWSEYNFILVSNKEGWADAQDTFYWEGRFK